MANREGPGPTDRDRLLWWRLLVREKFFWRAGDIRLVHPVKDKDAPRRAPDSAREDDGDPDPGRG